MAERNELEVDGIVVEALPNAMFKVELENGRHVTAHIASRLRKSMVRLIPGERVRLELTSYDLTRARITRRYR